MAPRGKLDSGDWRRTARDVLIAMAVGAMLGLTEHAATQDSGMWSAIGALGTAVAAMLRRAMRDTPSDGAETK